MICGSWSRTSVRLCLPGVVSAAGHAVAAGRDPSMGASEEAFQLVELVVDARPRSVRRAIRAGTQIVIAGVGADAAPAREATLTISYTYRVLVPRHDHL